MVAATRPTHSRTPLPLGLFLNHQPFVPPRHSRWPDNRLVEDGAGGLTTSGIAPVSARFGPFRPRNGANTAPFAPPEGRFRPFFSTRPASVSASAFAARKPSHSAAFSARPI